MGNIFISLTASFLLVISVLMIGETVYAQSATDNVTVTQAVTSGISITDGANITMTALSTSQNTAVGTSTWTVTTNNAAGYSLTVYASTAPAMQGTGGSRTIPDYTPAVAETPETWSVSSAYEFGFSARGTHVNTTTYGTDSDCIAGADVPSTGLKWRDFDLTASADQIAASATVTSTSGVATALCVATEQNGVFAPSDTYTATITGTATAL
jgi:hypothetical protein